MLRSIPIMVSGNALRYIWSNTKQCATYDDAIDMVQRWYNSEEKNARILTAWKYLIFTKPMAERPAESGVSVFKSFVAKLMSLQQQLDTLYHSDGFLLDFLITAVDVTTIKNSFRDIIPRTSHKCVNRVVNKLSEKTR